MLLRRPWHMILLYLKRGVVNLCVLILISVKIAIQNYQCNIMSFHAQIKVLVFSGCEIQRRVCGTGRFHSWYRVDPPPGNHRGLTNYNNRLFAHFLRFKGVISPFNERRVWGYQRGYQNPSNRRTDNTMVTKESSFHIVWCYLSWKETHLLCLWDESDKWTTVRHEWSFVTCCQANCSNHARHHFLFFFWLIDCCLTSR